MDTSYIKKDNRVKPTPVTPKVMAAESLTTFKKPEGPNTFRSEQSNFSPVTPRSKKPAHPTDLDTDLPKAPDKTIVSNKMTPTLESYAIIQPPNDNIEKLSKTKRSSHQ